jgi:hypothetical protein
MMRNRVSEAGQLSRVKGGHAITRLWLKNSTPQTKSDTESGLFPPTVLLSILHILNNRALSSPPSPFSSYHHYRLPPPILNMMLVQKAPNFPTSLPSTHNHHRRHPSAPVVVHPTRTPGLLSLSMAKPTPSRHLQQQQRSNRTPKTKPAGRSPKPTHAEAQQVNEAGTPGKAQQPTSGSSPDKHVRGRQQAHSKPAAKDKISRR